MGAAFEYSVDNYKFDYLLFLDDDSFLNVFVLDEISKTFPTRNMWWGIRIWPSPIIKDPKHRVSIVERKKEKEKERKRKKEKDKNKHIKPIRIMKEIIPIIHIILHTLPVDPQC